MNLHVNLVEVGDVNPEHVNLENKISIFSQTKGADHVSQKGMFKLFVVVVLAGVTRKFFSKIFEHVLLLMVKKLKNLIFIYLCTFFIK